MGCGIARFAMKAKDGTKMKATHNKISVRELAMLGLGVNFQPLPLLSGVQVRISQDFLRKYKWIPSKIPSKPKSHCKIHSCLDSCWFGNIHTDSHPLQALVWTCFNKITCTCALPSSSVVFSSSSAGSLAKSAVLAMACGMSWSLWQTSNSRQVFQHATFNHCHLLSIPITVSSNFSHSMILCSTQILNNLIAIS